MSRFPFIFFVSLVMVLFACKHKIPEPKGGGATTTTGTTTGSTGTPTAPIVSNTKDSICYSEDVQPLLTSNCAVSGCHDSETKREGIDLSSYVSLKRTISGPLLVQIIETDGALRMPPAPRSKLSSGQIATIKSWVAQGMKEGVDCLGPCDTTAITFSGVVFPIIANSCNGCHSAQTPLLTNYEQIKAQMDNGKLLCTINWQSGCSRMPENGPQLSLCKRRQIVKWLEAGAPNN
jgi:hypothetical protein